MTEHLHEITDINPENEDSTVKRTVEFTTDERRWWKKLCATLQECPSSIRLLAERNGGISAWRKNDNNREEEHLASSAAPIGQLND